MVQISFLLVFSTIATVLIAHAVAGKVLTTDAGVPLFAFLAPIALFGAGTAGAIS